MKELATGYIGRVTELVVKSLDEDLEVDYG